MSLTYLILAHRGPSQVARLVNALMSPDDRFLIHIDAKFDETPFRQALARVGNADSVTFLTEREKCDWGGYGVVQATLNGMRAFQRDERHSSHLVVMTGQDYPVKPVSEIQATYAAAPDSTFMFASAGDGPKRGPGSRAGNLRWHWDGDLRRLERRHYLFRKRWIPVPNPYTPFIKPRQMPSGLFPMQGSAYWAMHAAGVNYVLDFLDRRPDVPRFFRRVSIPDENIFQMILGCGELADTIVQDDQHWIQWNVWHPRILGVADVPEMTASPKLYARKFDLDTDPEVFDVLDHQLGVTPIATSATNV